MQLEFRRNRYDTMSIQFNVYSIYYIRNERKGQAKNTKNNFFRPISAAYKDDFAHNIQREYNSFVYSRFRMKNTRNK